MGYRIKIAPLWLLKIIHTCFKNYTFRQIVHITLFLITAVYLYPQTYLPVIWLGGSGSVIIQILIEIQMVAQLIVQNRLNHEKGSRVICLFFNNCYLGNRLITCFVIIISFWWSLFLGSFSTKTGFLVNGSISV